MVNQLKRSLLWLRRCRYSRGFGVQSPWAYHLIRYVINEHYPYYAYEDLAEQFPDADFLTRKLGGLYFRLANYRQPVQIVDFAPPTSLYLSYYEAGCRAAKIIKIGDDLDSGEYSLALQCLPSFDMVRITLSGCYREFLEALWPYVNERTILILEPLKEEKEISAFIREIKKDRRVGITFDLYYCHVLFLDTKPFKQHYTVNF